MTAMAALAATTAMMPMTGMTSTGAAGVTMVATMVAMMLPSVAATVWRYHRSLSARRASDGGQRTALFAAAYASVWIAISVALFASTVALSGTGVGSFGPFTQWISAAVVVCAGVLQQSRWKAHRLDRCSGAHVLAGEMRTNLLAAAADGWRVGLDCAQSCAAPTAVLIVGGLMDTRMMLVITVAITAERVARGGARIARLTGAAAVLVGVMMGVSGLWSIVHGP